MPAATPRRRAIPSSAAVVLYCPAGAGGRDASGTLNRQDRLLE